jgi:hypothetical protein
MHETRAVRRQHQIVQKGIEPQVGMAPVVRERVRPRQCANGSLFEVIQQTMVTCSTLESKKIT